MTATPAGWYPDPAGTPTLRWWDGTSWAATAQQPASFVMVNQGSSASKTVWAFLTVPLALLAVFSLPGLALFAGAVGGTAPRGWLAIEAGCITAGVVLLFGWQSQRTTDSQRTKALGSGLGLAALLVAIGILVNTTVG